MAHFKTKYAWVRFPQSMHLTKTNCQVQRFTYPRSISAEGNKQSDKPNSHTCTECCHQCDQ